MLPFPNYICRMSQQLFVELEESVVIDVDVLESSSFVSAKYGKKTPKPGDPITPKVPSGNNRLLSLKYHQTCYPILF